MSAGKKEKIFEGVMRLAREGADLRLVTVQQIADAAGIGKGTLYEYFSSREEIIAATLMYAVDAELERVRAEFDDGATFDAGLRCLCELSVRCAGNSAVGMQFLLAGAQTQADHSLCRFFAESEKKVSELLVRLVRRAEDEGLAPADIDEAYAVLALRAAFTGCCSAARAGESDPQGHVRRLVLAALRG